MEKKKNLSCASMRKRQGVKEETSVRITMQQNQPIRNRIVQGNKNNCNIRYDI